MSPKGALRCCSESWETLDTCQLLVPSPRCKPGYIGEMPLHPCWKVMWFQAGMKPAAEPEEQPCHLLLHVDRFPLQSTPWHSQHFAELRMRALHLTWLQILLDLPRKIGLKFPTIALWTTLRKYLSSLISSGVFSTLETEVWAESGFDFY